MMNKEYKAPTIEMILYSKEDIIHTSTPEQDEVDIDLDLDDPNLFDDDYINMDGEQNFGGGFGTLN